MQIVKIAIVVIVLGVILYFVYIKIIKPKLKIDNKPIEVIRTPLGSSVISAPGVGTATKGLGLIVE